MNKVKISRTNDKLGHEIPAINMPVGKTCRPDAPCFAKCYANKGHFKYKNVREAHIKNLLAYEEDAKYFFDCVITETKLSRFVRWHVSGDIVDAQYLLGMVKVAKANKQTEYLAFTKKFNLVNDYLDSGKKFPRNLHIVFSGWGAEFKILNPYNLPTTHVLFKDKSNIDSIPEGAIPCGGKCYECLACWQLKKGQSIYFKEH